MRISASACCCRNSSAVLPQQRAVFIDGVHHRPGERQKHHFFAFQLEQRIGAPRQAILHLHSHEHHARLYIHEVVLAAIDHAELQAGDVLVCRHQHVFAEPDARRRPRDAAEKQARGNRQSQHADQRFDGGHHISSRALGRNVAIAYCAESVRAEEEVFPIASGFRGHMDTIELRRAKPKVDCRKDQVDHPVA